MTNIFYGLEFMENNDIIEQIALLKVINNNIIKNSKNSKFFNIVKRKINSFFNLFSDSENRIDIDGNLTKEIENEIARIKENDMNKEQVIDKFKETLLRLLNQNDQYVSDDKLCFDIINRVSKYLGISLNEMPLYKANEVFHKYYDFISNKYNDRIYELKDIFGKYKMLSNVDELNKCYSIEEKFFFNNISEMYIDSEIVDEILGFIVYLLSSFCIPKILYSFKEFNELCDQNEESMFENILNIKRNKNIVKMSNNQKAISLKKEIRGLKIKIERDNKRKQCCIKRIDKFKCDKIDLENKLAFQKNNLEQKKQEVSEQIKLINDLDQNKKDEINNSIYKINKYIESLNNQLKSVNYQGSYEARFLEHTMQEISLSEEKIKKNSEMINEIEEINKKDDINTKKEDIKFDMECQKRINRIEKRWTSYFKKFTFDSNIYDNIKLFSKEQLSKVEMALLEMNVTSDKSIFSEGKTPDQYDYFEINSINREPIRIEYDLISDNKIHFVNITKKMIFI